MTYPSFLKYMLCAVISVQQRTGFPTLAGLGAFPTPYCHSPWLLGTTILQSDSRTLTLSDSSGWHPTGPVYPWFACFLQHNNPISFTSSQVTRLCSPLTLNSVPLFVSNAFSYPFIH